MNLQRYDGRGDLTQIPQGSEPNRFEAPQALPREDLQRYLRALWKRWWLVVALGLVAVTGAWWSERNAVPKYTARALLQLGSEAPVLPVGLQTQRSGEFASHLEIIRSRAVLLPAVDSLSLQLTLNDMESQRSGLLEFIKVDPAAPRGRFRLEAVDGQLALYDGRSEELLGRFAFSDTVEGPGFRIKIGRPASLAEPLLFRLLDLERATQTLQSKLRITPGMGPDLLWIRFSHPDRRHAANVVNAVASSYRQYRTNVGRQMAVRRRAVIADELVHLADSLERVQDQLLGYQSVQGMLNPQTEPTALVSERLTIEKEIRDFQFQERMLQTLVAELSTAGPNEGLQQRLLALGNQVIPGGDALQARLQQYIDERDRLTASRFGYTDSAPEVQTLDSLIASVKRQMQAAAEESLELLRARIASAESRLGQVRVGVSAAPEETAEFERLSQRVQAVQGIYDVMVQQYYEAQIAEGVETGDVVIVDPAAVPLWPEPSRKRLKLAMALLAGLFVGAVIALLLEQFDKSVNSVSEIERAARAPVLGSVPRIRSRSSDGADMRIGKEAFRTLRTNLRFARPTALRSVAVTSAEPGEGKSTVAANLTLALAEQGLQVVIVDADLRRPRIHQVFDVREGPGLAEILRGKSEVHEAVIKHPTASNLHIIPGGRAHDRASELIGGVRFIELLSNIQERFDIVVVDTAPILAFTDAALVSVATDGTVIVARAGKTNEDKLRTAVESLRQVNGRLLGVVLNATPVSGASSYYYEYYSQTDMGPGLTMSSTSSETHS